ncbi:MAG: hypothetical protein WCW36_01395 [Candidatus Paceibacterota bacterium]|jgi:hypothetical protein
MNETSTDIERIVMRRVHLIRILQLVISTAILAALAFTAALWGIGREVWVARVFENAPPEPGHLFRFYLAAFMHTRIIVQVFTVLTLVSLGFLAREITRFISVATQRRT